MKTYTYTLTKSLRHLPILLVRYSSQQRKGGFNLSQETITACSSSLPSPKEQPQPAALSASVIPAPCDGEAGPFTQALPSGNVLFEHHEGLPGQG